MAQFLREIHAKRRLSRRAVREASQFRTHVVATASEVCSSYGGALQRKLAPSCPEVLVLAFHCPFLTLQRICGRRWDGYQLHGWCKNSTWMELLAGADVLFFVLLTRTCVSIWFVKYLNVGRFLAIL
jgi:hypothetical protein